MNHDAPMVSAFKRLIEAAEQRESALGDPLRYIEVRANLERAAKDARALLVERGLL